VPLTVAVNCWVAPDASVAVPGDTITAVIVGGVGVEFPPLPCPQPTVSHRRLRAKDNNIAFFMTSLADFTE
jgi:hypothetical protein